MAKKLFIGNLPYNMTQDELRNIFSEAGNVLSAAVIVDKMTGRSRGFGFVEMEDADAEKAIAEINGKEIDSRKLVVNEARAKEERPQRRFRGGDENKW
jgi:RNA recognition motif-containing protein